MSFSLSPGVYGREIIRDVTSAPQVGFTGGAVIAAKRGPLEATFVGSEREFYQLYGRPTMDTPSMHCVARFLRGGSPVVVKRVVVDAVAASAEVMGASDTFLTINAANPGAWGNNLSVVFTPDEDADSLYSVAVKDQGETVETFVVSFIDGDVDGFGQPRYIMDRINSRSRYIRVDHNSDDDTVPFNDGQEVNLVGGSDDLTPVSDSDVVEGLKDFYNTDEVSVNYLMNAGWISTAVQSELVAVMESRKDGIVILDMPDSTNASDLVDFRKSSPINSSFAAFYAGWVRVLEAETGREVMIPPSGDVAAVFSRSQQQGAIWDAPAGLRRGVIGGVLGMNKIFSEADRDLLYKAGINPIQVFPGQGVVVWGQKTALGMAASLDRINVRFLLNYIRTTAVESLKPFVFQGNTEFTRASIFGLLDNFVGGIQADDGVYGYYIEVGPSLNTDEVIENNQLLVEIYVQPTRTGEFIRVDTITVPLSEDL